MRITNIFVIANKRVVRVNFPHRNWEWNLRRWCQKKRKLDDAMKALKRAKKRRQSESKLSWRWRKKNRLGWEKRQDRKISWLAPSFVSIFDWSSSSPVANCRWFNVLLFWSSLSFSRHGPSHLYEIIYAEYDDFWSFGISHCARDSLYFYSREED